MADIVRILQDIAEGKGLEYHYGRKSCLNLLDGSAQSDRVYFLHEFTERLSNYNTTRTAIESITYTGKFFLVKHSDYDQQYFKEVGSEETSKYTVNIEPLLFKHAGIGKQLACMEDLDVLLWSNIDVTDALDANMDGVLCNYKIQIRL